MKKYKFLLVDDHEMMRKIMGGQIRGAGHVNVIEVEDGIQARNRLQQGDIDFIVSDSNMPNMSGLELLRHVRANPLTKNLPFLMVTGEGLKEHIVEAIGAGADGYIVKPFPQSILAEKLDQILKKKNML